MGFINQFPYSDFHELNLDWLIRQTKSSMEAIQTLQEQMAEILTVTEEQVNKMINTAIAENNTELYNRMIELKSEITSEYKSYVQAQINLLTVYIDNQNVFYDNKAKVYAEDALTEAKEYTDTSVIDYTMMINPITGVYEDVRNVVEDIIYYFHSDGSLTAGEYDALELTATVYDAYEMTAYDYDFNGKNILTP